MSEEDEVEDNSECVDAYGAEVDWDTRFGIGPAPGVDHELDARHPLTERQRVFLGIIHGATIARGMPPTVRETGLAMGVSSPAGVQGHLKAMKKRGYVSGSARLARSLRVIPFSEHARKHGL